MYYKVANIKRMKFYYLNKHRQCPNYIGSKPTGFALVIGKKGERIDNILPVPLGVFVISGKIKLCLGKDSEVMVEGGQMMSAVFRNNSYAMVIEDCLCVRLYVQGNSLDFCHRIVSSEKLLQLCEKNKGVGKVLPMIPEVQAIMRQMTGYITDGLMCCDVHAMKQKELAAVLQAYYRPSDLLPFIAPIYDPNARFYNDVMKLAGQYLSVQEMASQLNMSYPTFIRHFRMVFKETPQTWLSKNRMKRLRDLLRNTAHTDQEIADELKFTTVQNMRAFCKTRSGLTTKQLREQEQ